MRSTWNVLASFRKDDVLPLINKCSAARAFLGHDHCGGGGPATDEDAWSLTEGSATSETAWSTAAALMAAFLARAFAAFSLRLLIEGNNDKT
jgi:hypothetical protein